MSRDALSRVRGAVRSVRRLFAPRGLILLYHRIGEPGVDPWELAVTPQRFDEHLAVIRSHGRPMHFRDLANAAREGRVPDRALAVAFDDGYADNLLNAKPLLERHHVPATVFVTTGGLDSPDEFWWDELERLMLWPGSLPETLTLRINGHTQTWELGDAATYRSWLVQERTWKGWEKHAPTSRHRVYRELWQLLRPLSAGERHDVRMQLCEWAAAAPPDRPTHRVMTRAEVAQLAAGGLVEVGAHTVSHPQLSRLAGESQQVEIVQSKRDLEAILGHPVTSFAYPYGDYAADTVAILQNAGFAAAGTTNRGCVTGASDPYRLPRLHVRNVAGDTFAGWVQEAMEQG